MLFYLQHGGKLRMDHNRAIKWFAPALCLFAAMNLSMAMSLVIWGRYPLWGYRGITLDILTLALGFGLAIKKGSMRWALGAAAAGVSVVVLAVTIVRLAWPSAFLERRPQPYCGLFYFYSKDFDFPNWNEHNVVRTQKEAIMDHPWLWKNRQYVALVLVAIAGFFLEWQFPKLDPWAAFAGPVILTVLLNWMIYATFGIDLINWYPKKKTSVTETPNAPERTDQEIREAFLRRFQRELAESKEPDKPVIGCMCHLMSLRELVGYLERLVNGEKIDTEKVHGLQCYVDTSTIRKVARMNGTDPVTLLDGN
jgi:hypothetical protein